MPGAVPDRLDLGTAEQLVALARRHAADSGQRRPWRDDAIAAARGWLSASADRMANAHVSELVSCPRCGRECEPGSKRRSSTATFTIATVSSTKKVSSRASLTGRLQGLAIGVSTSSRWAFGAWCIPEPPTRMRGALVLAEVRAECSPDIAALSSPARRCVRSRCRALASLSAPSRCQPCDECAERMLS